eukprot:TRINITY_DN8750_c0_g1_i5.p1 TRINITY_DN8750_c0_g1~~TRINITY_DN8750_c0_g1_i5.p1  ORF type:complete len:505 (+),score=78.24 TRINITY_DN8750_c0_g1_i5:158-1672(+)
MGGKPSKHVQASFSVWTGTWNLGKSKPANDMHWIPQGEYDIYALGVQESLYLDHDSKNPLANQMHFYSIVDAAIGEGYKEVCCQTLSPRTDQTFVTKSEFRDAVDRGEAKESGIRLMIWIRQSIADNYDVDVDVLFQTCGRLDGISGNKGGIACTLNIGGARLAFITAHLNAHMNQVERRNQDYEKINRELHDTKDTYGTQRKARANNEQDLTYHIEVMNRSDAVFWFGDINYRLQPLPDIDAIEEMKSLVCADIRAQAWKKMLTYDQLRAQQTAMLAFHGYEEAPINFPPTFKLNAKCESAEPNERYKKRVPSYCDRILWRTPSVNVKVNCQHYRSHSDVYTSDHLPVSAAFTLSIPAFPRTYQHPEGAGYRIRLSKLILTTADSLSPLATSDAVAVVTAGHPLGTKQASSKRSTINEPRRWSDHDELVITVPEGRYRLQRFPVLVSVRNPDLPDYRERQLGEGMISLMIKIRLFRIELYQGGKPFGVLSGAITVEELDPSAG